MDTRQPASAVAPMLAVPGLPPRGRLAQWAVEMKWDGVRALAFIRDGATRLQSRTGRNITATYPELAALAAAVPGHAQAVLDGEVVTFAGGRPDFEALQSRMNVSSPAAARRLAAHVPVVYIAFDVLELDGVPLLRRPYSDRRKILEDITENGPSWLCPPAFPGEDLDNVQAASVSNGLEGIVAKRLTSPYEPGRRSANWLKLKNTLRQEVVIAGWKPGNGRRAGGVGSLLIGVHDDGRLSYCGHVGTGFSDATLRLLSGRLSALRRPDSPFDGPVPAEDARQAVWVEPQLVAEVTFTQWTRGGYMRAPSYQGLRDDKDPADVVREAEGREH